MSFVQQIRAAKRNAAWLNNAPYDGDDTLGDFWSAIGMVGASAVQLLPGLLGGGSSSGQAHGDEGITAFGQQVALTLTRIREQMALGLISPQTAASEATRVEGYLYNQQYVDQPDGGSDRQALDQAKATARTMVNTIQNEASALLAAQTGQQPAATQDPVTGALSASPFDDKNVLLGLGVVGVAALVLLRD